MRPVTDWGLHYRASRGRLSWDCGIRTHAHRYIWTAVVCDVIRGWLRGLLRRMEE
jgi:hypothetical protein